MVLAVLVTMCAIFSVNTYEDDKEYDNINNHVSDSDGVPYYRMHSPW